MRKFYFLMLLLCPLVMKGQDLEDYLSKYTSENGQLYLQPFANAFTADLNSGLFHNAKIKKKGFQLYIGLVSQVAVIPGKAKTFTATIDDPSFSSTPITVEGAPTIFGASEGPYVENSQTGLGQYLPGGLEIESLPLAMPQITLGSIFGTDLSARYISVPVDDLGDIELFGWGIRHSVDQYLKVLPLSVAVGYYHQSFKVGNYIDAKTSVINLQASYNIPVITFYGGLGFESGNVDVEYTYEGSGDNYGDTIAFELESEGTVRATIGLCFNLGPVKLHGDYNMAKQNTFAVGLGIGINQK
ncbi:DUF6588 family protein [Plebeiibacterium sediminum]|uniref:Uncharacterized protein n=1 Tax=Plebeiibacterium sediminum TaxID=2992112 RepID=A0AAE3M7R9_9BACT|nr:DUF6588 family protein [Plebeiobacterium sediminum]MCW3788819.1 hypothetical protein [Plebeiobacterium sediminum]